MRAFAITLLLAAAASAKDIAVSPGDSLAKARDTANAGDRIVLRGGVYRLEETLRLGPQHSGVTWIAAPGEKPVLSGGIVVTGWTADTDGRYKATVNLDNFRQLWVNAQRAQRARGPAPAGMAFWGQNEATVIKHDNPPGLTGTPGYQPGRLDKIAPAGYTTTDAKLADWKNPSDMEMGFFSSWSHKIAKVEKITKADGGAIIEMSQPGFFLCNRAGGAVARMPAYLENALELLDEPGEWYFDRSARTLCYLPRPGEDLSKVEVIAPKLELLMEVKGAKDIRFTGLTFAHATWLRPSTPLAHPEVQANFIQPPDNSYFRPEHEKGWVPVNGEHVKSPANVVVDSSRGIRFEGCIFTALGAAGLDLQNGAQSNVVCGCRFEDIAANGIQVGDLTREDHHPSSPDRVVKDNQIVNNVITRTGRDYHSGIAVVAGYTEGTVIAYNEIFDVPYSGISIGWGWGMTDAGGGVYVDPIKWSTPTAAKDNRIEFNHIHRMMLRLNDGAGVYTLGRQPGTVIRGNHIHDGGKSELSGGVYLDEGSADIEIFGNAIYRVSRPLMFNNRNQNRRASCPVGENSIDAPTSPEAAKIMEKAGLEPAYRDLLDRKP
ncbi:MAG: right-handed parallel beta-helix repeat-containing protein [Rhodopirellula sp.]|nr:right-handed parallel beta-helix repeat-containing protein [Rhodopirellula sp.]